jgi:hypothetical protein
MSYLCPVCKSRLWHRPFHRRLKCPRCGAEFKPTVPGAYFQLLLVLFVLVSVGLVVIVYGRSMWLIPLFFCLIAAFFIFLPKLIDLQPIDFTVAEGPLTAEEMQLKLEYSDWDRREENQSPGFGPFYYVSIVLLLLIFVLVVSLLIRS